MLAFLRVVSLGRKRESLGIIVAILEAAKLGARKTRILSMANLCFDLLEKQEGFALKAGFACAFRPALST
jgi:predicted transcriptional regulator